MKKITPNVLKKASPSKDRGKPLSEERIPPGLEFLADVKTLTDVLKILSPKATNLDGFAAIFSGIHCDMGIPIPTWATLAAKIFWKAVGLDLTSNLEDENPSDVGKWVGFVEEASASDVKDKTLNSVNVKKAITYFCATEKSKAANSSPEISKQFFDERVNGKKCVEKSSFLPQRPIVYFFIATQWREIETFNSSGELHRSLLNLKIILPMTDAAETRKVCRSVGLKFASKAGRPLKKNNPVTQEIC